MYDIIIYIFILTSILVFYFQNHGDKVVLIGMK